MTDMIPRAEADALVAADRQRIVESVKAFRVHFSFGEGATLSDVQKLTAESYIRAVEHAALTPDDASAALEGMLADAEKRGMLRAAQHVEDTAKAYDTTVDDFRKARKLREADEMAQAFTALSQVAAAIRAEAGD